MKTKPVSSTSVKITTTYDRLSVKALFPTGGSVLFSITRSGERLTVGGSHDPATGDAQLRAVGAWIKALRIVHVNNGVLIEAIAEGLKKATSVSSLVAIITA